MTIKVFVLVDNTNVSCYHNLKQLCDSNPDIPYYTAYRHLVKSKSFPYKHYILATDTITYQTRRRASNNFR